MKFRDMNHLNMWISYHEKDKLGAGAQGTCFKIGNKVYKLFNEFYDGYQEDDFNYNREQLLQFSGIKNSTYIFPDDVIMVSSKIVGYMYRYVSGKDLALINPLKISLDKFGMNLEKIPNDIRTISNFGVETYDVMYNILYGNNGFYIIDSLEYLLSNKDSDELFRINSRNFDYAIKLFLTYDYFDKFIETDSFLSEIYLDRDVGAIMFLKELRSRLSEIKGYEIKRLGDASECVSFSRRKDLKYIRSYRTFVD